METFGHPATLRESFIIAADEMRKARGSSPPPTGHSQTFPVPAALVPEETRGRRDPSYMSDNTLTPRTDEIRNGTDETTPLIRRDYADGEVDHMHKGKSPSGSPGHSHAHGSMNMKAILLHVLGDALGNVGVIATGLIIWQTNWSFKYYFDPVISLVITVIIFSSAMPLGKSGSLETTR
jgi:zinc transporter 1